MTDAELLQYSRHLMLEGWDNETQERLQEAHCVVIGAGGLGTAAMPYLASAGLGRMTIVDDDVVELSNLQRQVLYRWEDIGSKKAWAAAQHIRRLNPSCEVNVIASWADSAMLIDLARNADVVLDCSDNFLTRQAINTACCWAKTKLVSASALQWQGQLISFDFSEQGANEGTAPGCYACIFPPSDRPEEGYCATYGVFAPLVGMLGSLQAAQTLKLLTQTAPVAHGRLQMYDVKSSEWQTIQTHRRSDCVVCAQPAKTKPSDLASKIPL